MLLHPSRFSKQPSRRIGWTSSPLKIGNGCRLTRTHPVCCCRFLLLPAASQRLVKLHEGQTLVELGPNQVEFG